VNASTERSSNAKKEFCVGLADRLDDFENDGTDVEGDQQNQGDVDDAVERVMVQG
jgi:hypothetical protein